MQNECGFSRWPVGMRAAKHALQPVVQVAGTHLETHRLKPVLLVRYADRMPSSAAFTRTGVSGAWRTRMPVASKIALAIAAAVARLEGSPAPLDGSSGWLIKTISTRSGTSDARATGYVIQSTLVTLLRSNVTSSFRLRPSDWIRLASIVVRSASGLMIKPQS